MHETTFIMEANTMNPDQNAPDQSDLGPYCLQFRLPKYILSRCSVSHSLKKGQGSGQKKGTFDA